MNGRLRFIGQPLLRHPYWTEVLGLPRKGRNRFLARAVQTDRQKQAGCLTSVAEGFFPISYSSPLAFGRVARCSQDTETQRLAEFIYEVERGLHPLVKGAPHYGTPHTVQFQQLMESLMDGITIPLPPMEEWEMLRKLDLPHADLTQALASCYVIEDIAGAVVHYFNDFVAQWQVLTGRPSRLIRRAFLDEHNLTEGHLPEQHSGMVARMLRPYGELVETERFVQEKRRYNEAVEEHLNRAYREIRKSVFGGEER